MKNYLNKANLFKNYFFAYLYIAPITIFLPYRQALFTLIFFVSVYEFFRLKNKFNNYFYYLFILTSLSFLLQTFYFERFNLSSTLRLLMNLMFPYFLLKIIGKDFIKYFIKLVYVICIISFIFYFPSLISDSIHSAIGKIAPTLGTDAYLYNQNFIIYTWEQKSDFYLRNSGNFTEPGYFAAILCFGLAFNIIHNEKFINKENIVFIIALITTFSTAGYLGLFYILTVKFIFVKKSVYKYLIIPIVVLLSYQTYIRLDFLQSKITNHYQTQVEEGVEAGRFGSALMDLKEINKYPIIGRGQTKATRFDEVEFWEGDEAPRPILNGITDTILKYGVIFSLIFFFLFFRSIKHYLKVHFIESKNIYIIIGAIFIVTFSQPILLTPIFLSLFYFKDITLYEYPKR